MFGPESIESWSWDCLRGVSEAVHQDCSPLLDAAPNVPHACQGFRVGRVCKEVAHCRDCTAGHLLVLGPELPGQCGYELDLGRQYVLQLVGGNEGEYLQGSNLKLQGLVMFALFLMMKSASDNELRHSNNMFVLHLSGQMLCSLSSSIRVDSCKVLLRGLPLSPKI